MPKTYYEELDLTPSATAADIKRQYRVLAQQRHPDIPGGNAEDFVRLQAAFDVLSVLDKREAYDKEIAPVPVKPTYSPPVKKSATPKKAGFTVPQRPVPPPPVHPNDFPKWRWTPYQILVAIMVGVILILLIRVGHDWGGGLGPALVSPAPYAPVATGSPTPTTAVSPVVSYSPAPIVSAAPTDAPAPTVSTTPAFTPILTVSPSTPVATVTPNPNR